MEKSEKGKLLVGKRGFLFLEEFDLSPSTVDFGIMTEGGRRRKRKWRETTNCLAQGWMRLFSPPSPLLGKPKRFLFHPPRIATTTLARERPSSPSVHPFLSSPLPALRRFRPSLLTAALFPIWLLDYLGVRRERAGTYDAIGYRISAGSLIGRSTAHGRSRSAPSYD